MAEADVSVCVVTYNGMPWIEACLRSVAPRETIVVDHGSTDGTVELVRERFPDVEVEVECDTLEQVREVVGVGVDLVLLDNMPLDVMRAAVDICRAAGVMTEASGGLRLDDARAVAETGVDYLAVGALTHSAPVLDLGVDLRLEA